MQQEEKVSGAWWLLPIFLNWVGGVICWFVLKDRNRRTARNMLILGLVLAGVAVLFWIIAAVGSACLAGLAGV